jgi:hypothetical protein
MIVIAGVILVFFFNSESDLMPFVSSALLGRDSNTPSVNYDQNGLCYKICVAAWAFGLCRGRKDCKNGCQLCPEDIFSEDTKIRCF